MQQLGVLQYLRARHVTFGARTTPNTREETLKLV